VFKCVCVCVFRRRSSVCEGSLCLSGILMFVRGSLCLGWLGVFKWVFFMFR